MAFELPKLNYAFDALEPNIDAKTIKFNEKKNFSRTVNISHLPFKFNYTTFEKSINQIFDIYHKNVISLIT